jgi:uncharacterized protein YyaL (SSP411 family)
MTNRLATATSPYLRSAAEQPIDWYPWGPEPFDRAVREVKPILLDIGAVWCHWCHVMDHESYEDRAVGELLDRDFVCIKVDRDERPDVDARYQRAIQGLSGQGGWPLTAFLTPQGEVFFGGTYFPPDGAHGRPGFLSVLRRVREVFAAEPERVRSQADEVRRFVERQLDDSGAGDADLDLLRRATRRMLALADRTHGGFGRAPKFPHPTALGFLLARSADPEPPEPAREVVIEALDRMALGGIRDHLGGGFHRYSTDERWIIPHFEKMSSDNSELLRLYAEGYAAFGRPLYAETARDILRWVGDVLTDPTGGYGASQDADVGPGDDGSYYTWSVAQIDEVLNPLEAKVAIARFGLGTHGRMPHDPTQNVLFVAEPVAAAAERGGLSPAEGSAQLERAVAKLRAARTERPTPFVDRTRYSGWNAMMAGAVLRAASVLGDGGIIAGGLDALRRLRTLTRDDGALAHGAGPVAGLLEDQVHAASAALDAFEVTGDPDWIDWARRLMDHAIAECWDTRDAGFADRPGSAPGPGLLTARAKPLQDNSAPAPNGVAGVVLGRLFELTRDPSWDEYRRRLLSAFATRSEELGLFAASYFQALDWAVSPVTHAVISGPAGDRVATAMHLAALATYLPRRVVVRVTPETRDRLAFGPELDPAVTDPRRVAGTICVGTRCLEPAFDPAAWAGRLDEAVGSLPPSPVAPD